MIRKRPYALLLSALFLLLSACAPVLDRSLLREGDRAVSFTELRKNPDLNKGRLFIFGGVIVQAKFTESGSQLEAMHVPVDRYGYFQDRGRSEGRFLAVSSDSALDPLVYRRGRRVTLAAEFIGTRKAVIDEMQYLYPVFRIRQIYLWPKERGYYPQTVYYYDPWFYPYPYYYWDPWWGYYYRRSPAPVVPPDIRRVPPQDLPNQPPPPQRRDREHERDRDHERR